MAPVDAEPALVRFPVPLPERFAAALGYRGRHGLVGLYWSAGDELAVYDPDAEALGLHEHGPYLGVVQRLPVLLWLEEQLIELGSAIRPATHHLVLDVARNAAYVAPAALARAVVARQQFDPGDFFVER
jgi:hypothetical protein